MIRLFLTLEWKAFIRSASFQMNLVIKILLGLAAIFYSIMILSLGFVAFYGLREQKLEPLSTINHYLIYWWAFDLVVRYFLQKTPVMQVKPFLSQPVKKKTITHFLLAKSAVSFFNIYPLFFFVPFSVVMLLNGYSAAGVICWHLAMLAIVYANNYLNLLIDNKDWLFISLAAVMLLFGGLQYWHFLDITTYTAPLLQAFYRFPVTGLVMLAAPVILYYLSFRFFYKALNLDDAVRKKNTVARTENYAWLNRFGLMGTFLKNDLKLLLRNKRTKATIWTSLFFLFYGLIIFSNKAYDDSPTWKLFAGIFIPGGFLFSFGGFIPSWDSSYFPLMMSQNIKYREYLASKWWLMVIVTLLCTVLASFYIFVGWDFYAAVIVGSIYNIGVNAHLVMLGGAYVKTPIDLSSGRKPFGDKKAFNLQTILIALPKLVLPVLIFYVFYKCFNETAGFVAVALLGLAGLAFRNKMFSLIEKIYKRQKYATLAAYKQKA